jgi:hypothetical protein
MRCEECVKKPALRLGRLALPVTAVLWFATTPADGQQQRDSSWVTREAREAFLKTARFVTDPPADGTPSWRVVLDDGTRQHAASVVTADGSGPTRQNYRFNVAAYELDRLLGLNLIPTTVERRVNGRAAAVTWWLDDFAMNELDRRRKRIDAPDQDGWDRQMQAVRVFDELISNTYRDPAPALYLNTVWDNLLITKDWTIWITDHTGAFRTRRQLQDPETLVRCPRSLLGRLRELTRPALQSALERYLSPEQLEALEVRRALLVKHFDAEIQRRGEGVVLYDLPSRQ